MGGDAACAALAAALDFLEDFLEALGDSVGGVADSGAVSGGGVSGADSPSPWGGGEAVTVSNVKENTAYTDICTYIVNI